VRLRSSLPGQVMPAINLPGRSPPERPEHLGEAAERTTGCYQYKMEVSSHRVSRINASRQTLLYRNIAML
jgi:hypothetical protein